MSGDGVRGEGGRGEGREEGKRGSEGERRGGLSGNVAEEAFCLKSAPANMRLFLRHTVRY